MTEMSLYVNEAAKIMNNDDTDSTEAVEAVALIYDLSDSEKRNLTCCLHHYFKGK